MGRMDHLRDLYAHQAWADAEHWRIIEAHHPAREDPALVQRLHHIHLVQHAFLSIVQGEAVVVTEPKDFPTLAALKNYARDAWQRGMSAFGAMLPERFDERIAIPWFREPPIDITVGQALLQAAMHSHYHRGQNATRLRELGAEPPLTDLIVWYWKGRPAAKWD
jgi:uncharacterized damage-inducible protein DinB